MAQDLDGIAPPVLDLAPFFENGSGYGVSERRTTVLEGINKAAQEWGLFQVINHGLDSSLLNKALENSRAFFALPLEEKLRLKTDTALGFVHKSGMVGDSAGNQRLTFAMGDHPACVYNINAWPETPTYFRFETEELAWEAKKTAEFLMTIMSQSLGLSKGALRSAFWETGDFYTLWNYEAAMTDCQVPALAKHQDGDCFSMVSQLNQVEGYQMQLKDGGWLTVQPENDALIVNIGDVLQVLTNGKYKSVVHRVVANKKERFSFAYHVAPGVKEVIAPLPQFTVATNGPPRYRSFNYGEYLQFRGENKKLDSTSAMEIPIEHYAI